VTSVEDGHRLFDVLRLQYSPLSVSGITEGSALVKQATCSRQSCAEMAKICSGKYCSAVT